MTRNKKIVISVISAFLAVIVLFSVVTVKLNSAEAARLFADTGVEITNIDFEKNFSGDSTQNLSKKNNAGKGFVKVAETDWLELYYKKDYYKRPNESTGKIETTDFVRYNIAVYDKKAKKLWTAIPDDKDIKFSKYSDYGLAGIQSLVAFEYYDIGKDNNKTVQTNVLNELIKNTDESESISSDIDMSQFEDLPDDMKDILNYGVTQDGDEVIGDQEATEISNVTLSDIPNGIRFTYNFDVLQISFAVDFKINGKNFDVSIPFDQISDKIQEYISLKDNRNKLASEINAFGDYIYSIKKSDEYKNQSRDNKKRIKIALDKISSSVSALADQLRSGGGTFNNVRTVESNIRDLGNTIASIGGFSGLMDEINVKFDEIKNKLAEINKASLCGLVSVTPLPYFGCATDKEEGYIFYPDKAGAISKFNIKHPEYATIFTNDVYSNYMSDIATYSGSVDDEDTDTHEKFTNISMPVFGVKKEGAAFVSIIAEGDSDAHITYTPYSSSSYMNSVNAKFYYRMTTKNTNSEGNTYNIIDPQMVENNRRLRYLFLAGDDADYAGMAVAYREYLEEFGLINKSKYMDSDTVPLFMNLFMGYKARWTSDTKYKTLTTFSQAKDILSDLKSKGVNTINTYVSGWSGAGYMDEVPDNSLKPENSIGGKDDLKELAQYAASNNVSLSLENQYIFGNKDYMTYVEKDIGTTKNYGNFTISSWNWFMFNPNAVYNKIITAVNKFKKYGVNSATLADEGRVIYNDYNQNSPYSRNLTLNTFLAAAKKVKEQLGGVNVEQSNIYMAQVADWFISLPEKDSEMLISDGSVPFAQIVLHGLIPYTGEGYNNMYEADVQKLKYIEYGYLPFYIVTHEEPQASEYYVDFLFSTSYSTWSNDIVSTVQQYQKDLGDVWNKKITDHETLKNGLVCVTYENGVKVLINYSKKDKKFGNITVKAVNYAVVR